MKLSKIEAFGSSEQRSRICWISWGSVRIFGEIRLLGAY